MVRDHWHSCADGGILSVTPGDSRSHAAGPWPTIEFPNGPLTAGVSVSVRTTASGKIEQHRRPTVLRCQKRPCSFLPQRSTPREALHERPRQREGANRSHDQTNEREHKTLDAVESDLGYRGDADIVEGDGERGEYGDRQEADGSGAHMRIVSPQPERNLMVADSTTAIAYRLR